MQFTTTILPRTIRSSVSSAPIPYIHLLGVPIHAISECECVRLVTEALKRGSGGWIVTPNLDHLRRCTVDRDYARTILAADLRVPDGMPLIWASRLQGAALPERVTGSNLIFSVSRALGDREGSVFLLGGEPGTAEEAAGVLQRACPGLRIAGTCCPEFGFEKDPTRIGDISEQLVQTRPDIVFVGLGSPKQEYLIQSLRVLLPRTWWLGVGVSFSFVCGKIRRAPPWMQRCGLEWVHRLMQEPRRLARRYLIDDLPYIFRLFEDALLKRYGHVTVINPRPTRGRELAP